MNKQPEKTAQTRRTLIDAFWALAQKQGLHSVTISGIAKKAGYNRSTFYIYFSDLDDLLHHAEEEILADFRRQMGAALADGLPGDLSAASETVIKTLFQHNDKLFLLLGKDGDPSFLARLREEAAGLSRLIFRDREADPYREYVVAYVTSAFAGMLAYWHDTGKRLPIQDLAGISRTLATQGMKGFL